jgi:transcriptional regulator with XRE-family HTH domain
METAILGDVTTVGANMRRPRLESKETQRALAASIGIHSPQWSDWENDRHGMPEMGNLLKIARALGCTLNDLMAGVDPDHDAILAKRRDLLRQPSELKPSGQEGSSGTAGNRQLRARYDALRKELRKVTQSMYRLLDEHKTPDLDIPAAGRKARPTSGPRS